MVLKMFLKKIPWEKGQSITELVIALALISVVFTSSLAILSNSFSNIGLEFYSQKANYLVIGGLEGMRSMRNEDWSSLSDGTWHFYYDYTDPENAVVNLVSGSELIDGKYTRSIIISSVRRDEVDMSISEDLLDPIDPDSKMVEVIVEWNFKGREYSDSEQILLTNWQNV